MLLRDVTVPGWYWVAEIRGPGTDGAVALVTKYAVGLPLNVRIPADSTSRPLADLSQETLDLRVTLIPQEMFGGAPKSKVTPLPKATSDGRLCAVLNFDGSCWPNPGKAQCGFSLDINGKMIEKTIGIGHGTNNIAEYRALIYGMQAALNAGVTHLEAVGDSMLVINGMKNGPSRKGKPHLEKLKLEALSLSKKFKSITFRWVPREENERADALSTGYVA